MLPSKGRKVKTRRNYHMKLSEFKTLANHVRRHCGPKYLWAIMTQFGMGFRSGTLVAVNILDYQDDFRKLQYRDNKSDEVHVDPVPDFLRELTKDYVRMNAHSLVNGWLLPNLQYPAKGYVSEGAYEAWFSKVRKAISKECPCFGDGYWMDVDKKDSDTDLQFNNQWRYRIGTHSLRRLHRTLFAENGPKYGVSLHAVKEMCHYKDWKAFECYINRFQETEHQDMIVNEIYTPIMRDCLNGDQSQTRITNFNS